MLDSKVWLDINLVGVGTYVNNDLVYLQSQAWTPLIRDLTSNTGRQLTEDDVMYNQNRRRYHAYNRTFVHLPSVVWSQGNFAAGLSTGARSYTAARKVPDFVARFIENGVQQYTVQHDIDYSVNDVKAAHLSFGEIKGSLAYTFHRRNRDMFMAGVSLSKFFSVAGAGANIYDFDFNVDNDSLIAVARLESDLMYTNNPRFNPRGGVGFDIGFTWQRMLSGAEYYYPNSKKMGCRQNAYKWKLGVSVIDIGSVKFDPNDIQFTGYNFDSYDWLNYADTDVDEDNATALVPAEAQPEGVTNPSGRVRSPEKVRLPTFASVQFDYNVWASRFYVNATIIQGIPVSDRKFGLRHANSLSVTPRYETYWFEAALPISLYEYQHPQLGLSLRFGPVTIGSDKLINWFIPSRLYGGDIFAHIKVPIQYHPKCKTKVKGSRGPRLRGRRGGPTDCTY